MSQIKSNNSNKIYWRSLEEKMNSKDIESFIANEFPEGTVEVAETMTRKKFLSLMGASMAMAGLVGCRKPAQKILPYVNAPEDIVPGIPNYYATTMSMGLNAYGVIVESHESRPTHIEGNENHPQSKGSVNSFVQASVLDLYDPDRIKDPLYNLKESTIDKFRDSVNFLDYSGSGMAVLSGSFNSPLTKKLHDAVKKKFPKSIWSTFDLDSKENQIEGLKSLANKEMLPIYHFDKSNVILSIESDFLGTDQNSIHNQKTFSQSRKIETKEDKMNRLYCVESVLSNTGMMADHRYKIKPNEVYNFIAELNNALIKKGLYKLKNIKIEKSIFNKKYRKFIRVLASDLIANKSKSLITIGNDLSPELHSMVFLLNQELGNNNKTIKYHLVEDIIKPDLSSVKKLINEINSGKINKLFILDIDFLHLFSHMLRDSINNLVSSIYYLGSHNDLTAKASTWVIPKSHYLEHWGDARAIDGTLSIVQPLISPLYNSISTDEFLSFLLGEKKSDYDLLKDAWKTKGSLIFKKTVHDGYLKSSVSSNTINIKKISIELQKSIFFNIQAHLINKASDTLAARFTISSQVYDGRYMNNYWLREASDAITKISWENVALLSINTAKKYGLKNSDVVELKTKINKKEFKIDAPVWVLPGIPNDTILLEMGYGRKLKRDIDRNYIEEDVLGVNVLPMKTLDNYFSNNITLSKTEKTHNIACTQDHHGLDLEKLAGSEIEKRLPEIIRESNIEDYRSNDDFVKDYDRKKHLPDNDSDLPSMYPTYDYSKGPQWGMNIDLNVCSGCNACSIACQSENNIPVVGKKQVMDGREMSWIRMDRYFKGDVENPEFALQPVACVHCENAPCEQVCPVAATTHDEEGLNGMTYNRCIGTRYCANNCPYKVRRFNYYNYTYDTPEVVQMANNPDVSIRFRGVMEKCSFCVQRISGAKITAKNENRELIDGDVKVACQSACAMDAITFGDITDKDTEISKVKSLTHDYSLLKELNTKPRTTYLAKFRNPHPDLLEHNNKKERIKHH